jgi:hypothetical protein
VLSFGGFVTWDWADHSNLMTRDDMSNIGLGDLGDDSHTTLRPDPSMTMPTNSNTTTSSQAPIPQERI